MDRQQQIEAARQRASQYGVSPIPTTSGNSLKDKWNMTFKETPIVKEPTFGGKIVRGVANDFSRIGNTLTAPVRAGIDKLAGFESQGDIIDPYAGNVTGYGMKEGQTTGQRVKDVIGGVATVASNVVGGGAVADIAKAGIKGAVKQGAIQGAKAGALSGAGTALQQDKGVVDTLVDTAIGGVAGGAIGGVTGGIAPAIKAIPKIPKAISSLKPNPNTIMNRVARLDPTDARKFQKMTGMTHGEYLAKSGNMNTPQKVIENEATKFIKSLDTADTEIAKLPGLYKSDAINTAINDLAERELRVSTPGALSPDYEVVKELSNKFHNGGGLEMKEINALKRLYEKNVKLGFDKQTQSEQIIRATNIDNALRNWQFKKAEELGLKNLPEINEQTQTSKFIVDALGKKLLGQAGNNAISLTDYIMLSGGDPTSIGGFLTKKVFSDPGVQAGIARMMAGKPTIGQVTADAVPTVENAIRRGFPEGRPAMLGGATSEFRSVIPSSSTMKVAPNRNFETVGKAPMVTPSKRQSTQVLKKSESTYTKTLQPKSNKVKEVINTLKKDIKNNGQKGSVEVFKSNPLIEEAKKYKSAEEFVNDFIYHGTKKQFDIYDLSNAGKGSTGNVAGTGAYFTNEFDLAKQYANASKEIIPVPGVFETKDNGVVLMTKKPKGEFLDFDNFVSKPQDLSFYKKGLEKMEKAGFNGISKNVDVLNKLKKSYHDLSKDSYDRVVDSLNIEIKNNSTWAKKLGDEYSIHDFFIPKEKYDGLIMSSATFPGIKRIGGEKDIVLFGKNREIKMYPGKTKSQLTDIWNQAQKQGGSAQIGMLPKIAGATAVGVAGANVYNRKKK